MATIFAATFKIGLFTFGGGLAMIPFLQAEFSEKRGWVSTEELANVVAAAQTLPGVMAVNTSLLTCYRVGGAAAAIVGTVGAILPSFLVLILVSVFYDAFIGNAYVRGALRGVGGAVAAMFVNTLIKMRKTNVGDWWAFAFFIVAFALIYVVPLVTGVEINVIFVILGAGLAGFLIFHVADRGRGSV
ncbi:MAG: chromate transporter [Oscillospiraceae bacterium]|nr:chromate transporter [Oscillospiraceae bacterium]